MKRPSQTVTAATKLRANEQARRPPNHQTASLCNKLWQRQSGYRHSLWQLTFAPSTSKLLWSISHERA